MIKGAIFDLDGTLINSLTFWDVFWPKFGKHFLKLDNFRPTLEDDKKSRTSMLEETVQFLHKNYNAGNNPQEIFDFFIDTMAWFYLNVADVKDGVIEFLEYLQNNNVKCIIATATPPKMLQLVLKKTGLDKFFPLTVSCNDVGVGKSKPDVFLYALTKIGTSVGDTLVFEDSLLAIKSAKSVNFNVVGVYDDNNFNQEEIKKLSTYYVDKGESFKKLINIL